MLAAVGIAGCEAGSPTALPEPDPVVPQRAVIRVTHPEYERNPSRLYADLFAYLRAVRLDHERRHEVPCHSLGGDSVDCLAVAVHVGADTFFTDSTGRVEVAMPAEPSRVFVDETRLPIWRGQMPDRGYIQRLAFDTIMIEPGSGPAEIPGTTVALAGARLLLAHPPDAPSEDWTPLDADVLQIASDSTVRARKRTNRYGVATWKGSELPALGEILAIGIDYDHERFRCVDAIHFDPLTISGKLIQHVCVRRDASAASTTWPSRTRMRLPEGGLASGASSPFRSR